MATTFSTFTTWRSRCVYEGLAGRGATLLVVVVDGGFWFEGDVRVDAGSRLCRSAFAMALVGSFGPVVETVHVLAGQAFEGQEIEDVTVLHGTVGADSFDIALGHLGVARRLFVR